MPKRILWLLNHKTLMKAEIPVLFELGYEVYIPKSYPDDNENLSGEISYQYDQSLTIDKKDLDILNKHYFYGSKMPARVKRILERDFDAAICGFFPDMLNVLADCFSHTIYVRVFGLSQNLKYGDLMKELCTDKVYQRFVKRDHMMLAPSYSNIIYNEPFWLSKDAQFLPLGLPEEMYEHQDTWTGLQEQILFVCPRIKTKPYYTLIYENFKNQFGDLPHIIVGKQVEPVDEDPSVLGYVEQETLEGFFRDCRVMFYHSEEIRHLHYHPLEAMLYGMPVIYMAGGLLDQTAGEHLPGCCMTTAEAYDKLSRILDGDEELIEAVRSSQKLILEKFSNAEILKTWKLNFKPNQQEEKPEIHILENQKDINLGIWVHNAYPQGMTGEGINQVLGRTLGSLSNLSNIHITIACYSWIKPYLLTFLNAYGVDEDQLDLVVVSKKPPFILYLYEWYISRKPTPPKHAVRNFINRITRGIRAAIKKLSARLLSIRSVVEILLLIILSPLILAFGIVFGILGAITYYGIRPLVNLIAKGIKSLNLKLFLKFQKNISFIYRFVFNRMAENELPELVRKASKNGDVDTWLFFYPNMPQIEKFTKPTVLVVPDIVYNEFPTPFARELPEIVNLETNINKTVKAATHIVTYSEHVKREHLVHSGLRTGDAISVVRHAPMSSRDLIDANQSIEIIKSVASRAIKDYLEDLYDRTHSPELIYLKELPWGHFDYLFVSSQTRPHKNHFNMIKAYRILLREKYKNTKLIFTGGFPEEMQDYIEKQGLQYDVLSIPQIPAYEHAAFFACAKLAIAPTLFEGGFPFTFSQAVSVGTPILMSNIPVVQEILGKNDISIFKPYAVQTIVDKMVWAWDNYDYLLAHQKKIYEQMTDRTWDDVALDFNKIFARLVHNE